MTKETKVCYIGTMFMQVKQGTKHSGRKQVPDTSKHKYTVFLKELSNISGFIKSEVRRKSSTAWLIILHIYCILVFLIFIFRCININYYIAFCIMHMQEHSSPWLRINKKIRVNSIYSWSRGFVFQQKLMIKYKSPMFTSRDVCIYFG